MALKFAVVRSLWGVPTHLQDAFLVWSLDMAVEWSDKGHRPDDKYRYLLKGREATQFWRVVREALAYVVSVAEDGAASATNSTLSADTTPFASQRSAVGVAGATAPAGARTIQLELRDALKSCLHLLLDGDN